VSWKTIGRVADEANAARVEPKDHAALDAELAAAGVDLDDLPGLPAEPEAKAPAPPPKVRPARTRRAVWLIAAAIGAMVLLLIVMNGAAIVAFFKGEPIRPDDEWVPWKQEPTPQQRAAAIRKDAYTACADGLWVTCEAKLDEAKAIDPAGETDPRVVVARRAAYAGQHPEGGTDDKQVRPDR
jgi:hypothetical protein